ncbi:diaminopimelate decarboxylase [Mycolicibacterium sp. P1-18]|uniref:diaminopimelate decarboxylase n=1 Tax=Mycolicibacterium sp. P1-18 TaxID=2024615 RepID=UPI0011F1EB4D|nr:diaminopimelate decarboxylase [Mycolicibacterium sp. P1-18]KAA0099917.1 diaminopimelate decarboxylase [Mycolicibacterium sp. P1-18]
MTLLDHLPSLRRAAAQRICADLWPRSAVVDELGRLCVGGVAITDVAAQFGTPTYILDEAELRRRLRAQHAGAGDLVPVLAARSLPTTVMRWIDDEGVGLAIRSGADLAAARAAGVEPARMVVHARGLSHDDLVAGAAVRPGRLVVDSTMDVAYLCGRTVGRQRVLIGAPDGSPDPAVVDRVLHEPALDLVGFHCRPGDDVESSLHQLFSAMRATRRNHGRFLTEVNLAFDSAPATAMVDDALDAACAATRLARPRVVVESPCSALDLAGVTAYRVASVISPVGAPRILVLDAGGTIPGGGIVALANRHPLSTAERVTVTVGEVEIARDVLLPCDVHPGDVLAVARCHAGDDAPVVAVRDGVTTPLTRRLRLDEVLSRDLGYSARGGHDQHVGGRDAHRHPLAGGELPGL